MECNIAFNPTCSFLLCLIEDFNRTVVITAVVI